ncbi:MAG: class II aldolase/adducin family protein [Candidatus Omnitrophota bacterium]|nr:class II aldolase/adducin family protein [Candidatus Omnitrophota bacterium]
MKDFRGELIKYGKLIYAQNLVTGCGGNISVRVGSRVYIKASGVSLENSTAADYNEADLKTGKVFCRKGPCSVELPMHIACYKARADIGAVIHTHPVYGTILAMLIKKLGFVSYEFACALSTEVPVISYKKSGSRELANAVAGAIKKHNAVLLKNHGAIVVGKDLEEAYQRSVVLERSCKIYVLSKLAGKVSLIGQY